MAKKSLVLVLILAFMLVVAGCRSGNTGPVARVNGEEISRALFDAEVEYNVRLYRKQGYDLTKDDLAEIKEMVREQLINTALLLAAAEQEGITRDSVDVDGRLAEILAGFGGDEKEFEALLKKDGLSLDEYKAMLAEYLVIQELLAVKLDLENIEVSEEEIQEFFDTIQAQYGDDLKLEDWQEYLVSILKDEKANEMIGNYIKELRDASEIEYFDL